MSEKGTSGKLSAVRDAVTTTSGNVAVCCEGSAGDVADVGLAGAAGSADKCSLETESRSAAQEKRQMEGNKEERRGMVRLGGDFSPRDPSGNHATTRKTSTLPNTRPCEILSLSTPVETLSVAQVSCRDRVYSPHST